MPTKHRRVSVTVDETLETALERARRLLAAEGEAGPSKPADASLIHVLALEGAARLEREDAGRQQLLDELADPELSTGRLDPGALEQVLALRERDPLGDVDA